MPNSPKPCWVACVVRGENDYEQQGPVKVYLANNRLYAAIYGRCRGREHDRYVHCRFGRGRDSELSRRLRKEIALLHWLDATWTGHCGL